MRFSPEQLAVLDRRQEMLAALAAHNSDWCSKLMIPKSTLLDVGHVVNIYDPVGRALASNLRLSEVTFKGLKATRTELWLLPLRDAFLTMKELHDAGVVLGDFDLNAVFMK